MKTNRNYNIFTFVENNTSSLVNKEESCILVNPDFTHESERFPDK